MELEVGLVQPGLIRPLRIGPLLVPLSSRSNSPSLAPRFAPRSFAIGEVDPNWNLSDRAIGGYLD